MSKIYESKQEEISRELAALGFEARISFEGEEVQPSEEEWDDDDKKVIEIKLRKSKSNIVFWIRKIRRGDTDRSFPLSSLSLTFSSRLELDELEKILHWIQKKPFMKLNSLIEAIANQNN